MLRYSVRKLFLAYSKYICYNVSTACTTFRVVFFAMAEERYGSSLCQKYMRLPTRRGESGCARNGALCNASEEVTGSENSYGQLANLRRKRQKGT